MQSEVTTRKYCAFISYRHKELDKYVAKKLHTMIERYTIPGELRESWGGKKLGKVFRDEEELPVSSNLTDSICTALDNTDYLIVVCTPDTPESIWVEREIKYFLEHHDRSHVIAVLVDGTPDTSFPKLITTIYDEDGNVTGMVEPLAANLTGVDNKFKRSRMHKEAVRLYAAIMGVPFDSLWQREKRHNLHCIIALVSVAAVVALGYCISIYMKNVKIEEQNEQITNQYEEILAQNKTIEDQNKEISDQNREISEQNKEITAQYEDIKQKNKELRIKEAEALLGEGELLYEKGDLNAALECAVKSISTEEGREAFADDAEYLLTRALGSLHYSSAFRTVSVIEHDENIEGLLLSDDESRIYVLDGRGFVRCYDSESLNLIWKGSSKCAHDYFTADKQRLKELSEYGLLLCLSGEEVTALSIEDGSEVWSQNLGSIMYTDFHVFTKDNKTLAVIVGSDITDSSSEDRLMLLNTADGKVTKEIPLGNVFGGNQLLASGENCGVFSDDGKKLAAMVYYNKGLLSSDTSCIFVADLEKDEVKIIREVYDEDAMKSRVYPFVIGMEYGDDGLLTVVHYDSSIKCIMVEEFDGEGNNTLGYQIDYVLPARESYKAYKSTFERYNDRIAFSCEAVIAEYSLSEKDFTRLNMDSGARVLNLTYVNHDMGMYAYITDDGSQSIYYGAHGVTKAFLSDKNLITHMAISDDYMLNRNDIVGVQVKDSALLVEVTAANPHAVYVLRPDIDKAYAEVDWFDKKEDTEKSRYRLEYITDGMLAIWHTLETNLVKLKIVDTSDDSVKASYDIDTSDGDGVLRAASMANGAKMWSDGKHFTFGFGTTFIGTYDLETGKGYDAFPNETLLTSAYALLDSGEMLYVAICNAENFNVLEPEYVIKWRIGEGDIQTAAIPEGFMPLTKNGMVKYTKLSAGSNGLIVAALSNDESTFSSYLWINTADGNTGVAEDRGPGLPEERLIVVCEKEKAFLIFGTDGVIRMVSGTNGELIKEIQIAYGISDIANISFLNNDANLAVWTKSRILYIFDTKTGEVVFEGGFANESSASSVTLNLSIYEDPARNRAFFVTSRGAVIILNTKTWKKQADFYGFSAYCPDSGELYRLKNAYMPFREEENGIIKIKVNTLDEYLQSLDR